MRARKLARGAGRQAQLMAKEGKMALLKLPSGEQRMVQAECRATIGQVGNLDHENISIGKAGRSSPWLGKRAHVRGIAMNPVDHPHGGGEGTLQGQSSAVAVGTAGQGLQDARQEAVGPSTSSAAGPASGKALGRVRRRQQ